MKHDSLVWGGRTACGFLSFWLLIGAWLLPATGWASHLRAGDIQARADTTANPNPRRIFFNMTIYRDRSATTVLQEQQDTRIYFGDGTSVVGTSGSGSPIIRTVNNRLSTADTEVLNFTFEHTYPAVSSYVVSFIGENRNSGIQNMSNSQSQSFFISTRVTVDPALRGNRSPVLLAPAYDKAGLGQVFLHNPAAYDADGDSLTYELQPCRQVLGGVAAVVNNTPAPQTCVGYVYPDDRSRFPNGRQVPFVGPPAGAPGSPAIFVQDPQTGQIVWNSPGDAGLFNVAFVVREWRRSPFGARLIGEIIRDMQIIVYPTNNIRPTITIPPDLCVVAGTAATGVVTATDGSGNPASGATAVTLFAYGGMLPPATFTQTQAGPPLASANFRWNTTCADVSATPYSVLFKAQDNPPRSSPPLPSDPPPLIDQRTWRITVVGPPPQNLQATSPLPTQVALTWDAYTCANASTMYIYRKEGPSGFVPGPCDTGIPASAGYTLLGSVPASATRYTDTGGATGFGRGKTYCYRIYAEFPAPKGGASIASQEVCISFPGRAALLKNVDIERTSPTTGQISVRWTPARAGSGPLLTAPFGYRVYRGSGTTPTTFALVRTFTSLDDTVLVDTGLNTQDIQYAYKLEVFYAASPAVGAPEIIEQVAPASSVFTTAVPDGINRTISLRWAYNVPWDNAAQPVHIYRRNGTATVFTDIATAPTGPTGGTYLDNNPTLQIGQTYCYYVQTTGRYRPTGYLSDLINKSQETCKVLAEVPCNPQLVIVPPNCDSLTAIPGFPLPTQRYENSLHWSFGDAPAGCSHNASYFRIFYSPVPGGPLVLLDSTSTAYTVYTHRYTGQAATSPTQNGCYAVQAVTATGLRSQLSNVACQTSCIITKYPSTAAENGNYFLLPNIFTPQNDGLNDFFQPISSSPLRRVHFQAFNRWGRRVAESTTEATPFIHWDGGGPSGENKDTYSVSNGIYYYLAEVEFDDASHTTHTYKGWVEIVR